MFISGGWKGSKQADCGEGETGLRAFLRSHGPSAKGNELGRTRVEGNTTHVAERGEEHRLGGNNCLTTGQNQWNRQKKT